MPANKVQLKWNFIYYNQTVFKIMQLNWHAGVKKVENYVTCLDIVPLFLFLSILFAVLGKKIYYQYIFCKM